MLIYKLLESADQEEILKISYTSI